MCELLCACVCDTGCDKSEAESEELDRTALKTGSISVMLVLFCRKENVK